MAAAGGGVRIEGLNQKLRDLRALGLDLSDLKGAMSKVAEMGARLAASYAPVRSGALARGIRGNKARNKAVVSAGTSGAPRRYAGVINYGWARRGIPASGFLQKADQEMRPFALREFEREIDKAIRRRGLRNG